jgi:hypothetical protein
MAQYTYYTDPATGLKVRDGVRDDDNDGFSEYVIDKELVIGGFSGIKDVDWELIGGAI